MMCRLSRFAKDKGTMEEFASERMLKASQHVLVAVPDIAHTKIEEQSRSKHTSEHYTDSTWSLNPALNEKKAEIRESRVHPQKTGAPTGGSTKTG